MSSNRIRNGAESVDDATAPNPDSNARSTDVALSTEQAPRGAPFFVHSRYADIRQIAGGAFGDVRRVRDTHIGRVIAMKIMRREILESTEKYARFVAEVEITAELQHPGVVPLYDCGEFDDGRLWFTMQEIRGQTLSAILDDLHGPKDDRDTRMAPSLWTQQRAIDVLARIAQIVAFAYSKGIVHRDLKPSNVMVGEHGEALVIDWGVAQRLRPPPTGAYSSLWGSRAQGFSANPGEVLGTPAYMAPEQALGTNSLHPPASDVYSLGAILYHLLVGKPPYQGPRAGVLANVKRVPPVPIADAAKSGASLPKELVVIAEKAMNRQPALRHEDTNAFAQELIAWLRGAP